MRPEHDLNKIFTTRRYLAPCQSTFAQASVRLWKNMTDPLDIHERLKGERSPARKIEILLQACRELQYVRPLEALDLAQQARRIAKTAKLVEREIHCIRMGGICLYAANDLEGALAVFSDSLRRYRKIKDTVGVAKALQNMGLTLRGLARYDEALRVYNESVDLLKRLGDDKVLSQVYINIGAACALTGRPASALEAYTEALAISEKLGDVATQAQTMGNIADIYIQLGDHDKSIEWSRKSLELHRVRGEQMGVGLTLSNLGRVYQSSGNLDSALAYFTEALAVMTDLASTDGRARVLCQLAELYVDRKAYVQAQDFAQQARELFQKTRDVDWEIRSLLVLADANVRRKKIDEGAAFLRQALGLLERTDNKALHADVTIAFGTVLLAGGQTKKAVTTINSAIEIATKADLLSQVALGHGRLAEIAEQAGDYRTALKHERARFSALRVMDDKIHARHSQALQLRLDIERSERERAVMRLNTERLEFDLESREREINTSALSLAQKNDLMSSIIEDIDAVIAAAPAQRTMLLKGIRHRLSSHMRTGEDWKNFADKLKDVHDNFHAALTAVCPELTPAELKIASLLKLNLSSKEIADILHLGIQSVDIYRHRLRKKLKLPSGTNLISYLASIG